MKAKAMIAIDH